MRKFLIVVMFLTAVLFVSNIAESNASNSNVVTDAGDYRENNPVSHTPKNTRYGD